MELLIVPLALSVIAVVAQFGDILGSRSGAAA